MGQGGDEVVGCGGGRAAAEEVTGHGGGCRMRRWCAWARQQAITGRHPSGGRAAVDTVGSGCVRAAVGRRWRARWATTT
jgi:hypothetical protein